MVSSLNRYNQRRLSVTKAEIIDRIAHGTGLTKLETEVVVNGFLSTVVEALMAGDTVELRNFGAFRVHQRKARTGRNPQTSEAVEIAARNVPVFKAARAFSDAVADALPVSESDAR